MRLCEASPFCVRARIHSYVLGMVHRREVRLMRQWIQDHVSSPVGANLNRVRKLSNLYLCIHWECNEIGARARVVLVLSFVKQADTVRTAFVFTLWRNLSEKSVDSNLNSKSISFANSYCANLSWIGPLLQIAWCEKYSYAHIRNLYEENL